MILNYRALSEKTLGMTRINHFLTNVFLSHIKGACAVELQTSQIRLVQGPGICRIFSGRSQSLISVAVWRQSCSDVSEGKGISGIGTCSEHSGILGSWGTLKRKCPGNL